MSLRRLYVTTSAILVRITLPLLVVVLVQADWLLTIFGEDYTGAAWISRVLVLGVLFDTAISAGGPILNMAGPPALQPGRQRGRPHPERRPQRRRSYPCSTASARRWPGPLTFLALGTARMLQVKGKVLGVLPFSSPMWNMLIAGAVSGLVGWSLRLVVNDVWTVFPVALVMILVYFGVSIALGIGDDERWVARSFLRTSSTVVP